MDANRKRLLNWNPGYEFCLESCPRYKYAPIDCGYCNPREHAYAMLREYIKNDKK